MPIPEGDALIQQATTIAAQGLIPVRVFVYDDTSETEADSYLVACLAVPRIGEVIDYGESKLKVFGVFHEFKSQPGLPFRLHAITVAGREAPKP